MTVSDLISWPLTKGVQSFDHDLPPKLCRCGHVFIRHEGDTGGHCMDCECLEFSECANAKP